MLFLILMLSLSADAGSWSPYNARDFERPEPKLSEPWQFIVRRGQLDHREQLIITGDSKGARVERMFCADEKTTTWTRGKLSAAQVKELRANAAALKYWAMVAARKKVEARQGDDLLWNTYRTQVSQSVKRGSAGDRMGGFELENACPCEACDCPQRAFIDLLEKMAAAAKPEKVAPTAEKKVTLGKPVGAPLDAGCSEKPVKENRHWCEVSRGGAVERYDHCYARGKGVFSCFATPYSPELLVKRTSEASGYMPDDPWAIELETGERCTNTAWPSQWTCSDSVQLLSRFRGKTWVAELPGNWLIPIKVLYR